MERGEVAQMVEHSVDTRKTGVQVPSSPTKRGPATRRGLSSKQSADTHIHYTDESGGSQGVTR